MSLISYAAVSWRNGRMGRRGGEMEKCCWIEREPLKLRLLILEDACYLLMFD